MNFVPFVPSPSSSLQSFSSTGASLASNHKINPKVVLKEYVPQALKDLGSRIGMENHDISFLKPKDVSLIQIFKEENKAFQSALAKIYALMEKGLQKGPSLSSETKELEEEINQIEANLLEKSKQGSLTSKELGEELEIAKGFHNILSSMNEYLEFQQEYQLIDQPLEKSLTVINDSIFSELHGMSPHAFLGIKESIEKMHQLIQMTVPFLKGKSPFTPEVLKQLNFEVNSTLSICSDWFHSVCSHADNLLSLAENLWKEALGDQKGTDWEKFARVKEAGDLLLSLKNVLDDLGQHLHLSEGLLGLSQIELDSLNEKRNPVLAEMQENLGQLLEEMDRVDKLQILKTRINEKEMEQKILEFSHQVEASLRKGQLKAPIANLLQEYHKRDLSAEDKLSSYIKLKRQLNLVLSFLQADQAFYKKVHSFFATEEKHFSQELGDVQLDDLLHAQLIKSQQPKPHWLSQTFSYLNPDNWSKATKRVAHAFMLGMQLTEQGIHAHRKMIAAPIKASRVNPDEELAGSQVTAQTAGFAPSWIGGAGRFLSSLWTAKTHENPLSAEEEFFVSQEKTLEQLQKAKKSLNEMSSALDADKSASTKTVKSHTHSTSALKELKKETALLLESLREAMREKPETSSALPIWVEWSQKVEKQCFAVKMLEKQINEKMKAYLQMQGSEIDGDLEIFGNKHKNLVKQARLVEALELPGVHVPLPRGISTGQVTQFLKGVAPQIFAKWQQLGQLHANFKGETPFLENKGAASILSSIQNEITKAFAQVVADEKTFEKFGLSQEILAWIASVDKKGNYLMVRSTGAEDSKASANAGGNVSVAYVKPTPAALAEAMGKVVSSYFGASSLQNRLNAELNPFKEELRLAVTAQELIGEPVGGSKKMNDIPISLVLFTNEPLYIGDEEFRVMRFSATHGHGDGVVGNYGIASDTVLLLRSVANPDQVYILYDNQLKPERLAPVNVKGKVILKKVPNNEEMTKHPALDKDQILRLYQWGIVGEKFFEDYPTDMEIVVKGDTIYPIQARPINRPSLLPTYLDLKKMEGGQESPLTKTLAAEMLVPGKASVLEIAKLEEILIAETLEKAEGLFRKGQHKLVVVGQQEPANSHPVVNFSSLGVPCLFSKDLSTVQEMAKGVDENHPIAVCVQSAILSLWDHAKGKISDYTTPGFVVHPAKIAISLPMEKPVPKAAGVFSEMPEELSNLFKKLSMSTKKENSLKSLQNLQEHVWIKSFKEKLEALEKKVSENPLLEKTIRPTIESAKSLNLHLDGAFSELKAMLEHPRKEQKLEFLFHLKALKNLLQSPSDGLSQHSVLNMESAFKAADALIAYQENLTHPAIFTDVLMDGTQSPIDEVFNDWNKFLLKLEPLAEKTLQGEPTGLSVEAISTFKNTLAQLREGEVLPLFMTFFLGDLHVKDPVEALFEINKMMPVLEKPVIEQIAAHKKEIAQLKNDLGQFGDPKSFPSAWERLKTVAEAFSPENLPWLKKEQWDSSSPITRSLAIKSMNELIDVYDSAIKARKASQQFNDPIEKTKIFKEMLGPYLKLLEGYAKGTVGAEGFVTHSWWPLSKYLKKIEKILTSLSASNPVQLNPSSDFSVSAAALGSNTDFERHYPKTLEDLFTLIHQNLLASTSQLTKGLFSPHQLSKSFLPNTLKKAIEKVRIISSGQKVGLPQQIGIEVDKTGITIHYNVPLANHSSKFSIHYQRQTRKTTMKSLFIGEDISQRWQMGLERVLFFNSCGMLLLESPPRKTPQELSYSWDIRSEDQIAKAFKEFGDFADMTLGYLSNDYFIERMEKQFSSEELLQKFAKENSYYALKTTFLENILKKGGYEEEIFSIAKEGIKNLDREVTLRYRNLFDLLIKKGFREKIMAIAKEGMNGDLSDQTASLRLWYFLYEEALFNGEERIVIVQEGIAAAQKKIKNSSSEVRLISVKLMQALVNRHGIDEAILVAKEGMKDADPELGRESANLLLKLASKENTYMKQATAIANEVKENNGLSLMSALFFFSNLFRTRGRLQGIEEAIFVAKEGMKNKLPEVLDRSLRLFQLLVKNKTGFSEALAAAKQGVRDSQVNVRKSSLELLTSLVQQGQGVDEALIVAKEGMKDADSRVRMQATHLLLEIVAKENKHGKEVAALAKEAMVNHSLSLMAALSFFVELVWKGHGIEEAIFVAKEGIQDKHQEARNESLFLWNSLVQNESGFSEAIAVAREGIKDSELSVRKNSLGLFSLLVKKGQGFDEAFSAVKIGMKDNDSNIRSISLKLLEQLTQQGHCLDEAAFLAIEGMKDSDLIADSNDLISKLVEQGYGFEAAYLFAKEEFKSSNLEIAIRSFYLLKNLIEKDYEIEGITVIAKEGLQQKTVEIQRNAFKLLRFLVKKDYAIKEALEIANAITKIPQNYSSQHAFSQSLVELSQSLVELLSELVEKGHGIREAAIIAQENIKQINNLALRKICLNLLIAIVNKGIRDRKVSDYSFDLLIRLVEKSEEIDKIILMATEWMKDPSSNIRDFGISAFMELIPKGHGIKEVEELIKQLPQFEAQRLQKIIKPLA